MDRFKVEPRLRYAHSRPRFRVLATTLMICILALSACGGSSATPSTETESSQTAESSVVQTELTAAPAETTEAEEPTATEEAPTATEEEELAATEESEPTATEEAEPTATEEAQAEATATEEVAPAATEESTVTAAPAQTAEPTAATPAQATVRNQIVNIREGPSARKDPATGEDIYRVITTKNQGEVLEVIGRGFLDFPWVQVRLDGESTGWVSSDPAFAELNVPIETLPLVSWYPPNSVLQRTIELNGPHAVEVENMGEQDAVLVLAQELTPAIAIYVRAGGTYTVEGMPDGTFEIFDSRGANWNGREFMTDASRSKWAEPLPFESDAEGNAVIWTLTLDAGENEDGESAETDPVTEDAFPEITTQE